MNLPEVHERVMIVQNAEGELGLKIYSEYLKDSGITMDEAVNIYSQCILNLSRVDKDESKIFISDTHKEVEKILSEVSKKFNLTYGEKVKILASRIQNESKYIIRWERHKDFEKEGDWA
ncbi:hypothetical protein NE686_18170 [Tissierella carlieri]|uniref:Chromo domain-containing protein n=1 Tax=Tissierella carlieri TaxID=689904 RepID=A0ABT1SEW6_9FIRM|nr:hypothetical protein [Tissierella carlieri]MCQ4925033.1 hypothetical protein [Tissierella carlieri]